MADSPSRGSNCSEDFNPTANFDLGVFLGENPGALNGVDNEVGDYDFEDDDDEKKLIGPFDGDFDLGPGVDFMAPCDDPFQAAFDQIDEPMLPLQPLDAAPLVAAPVVNEASVDDVAEYNEPEEVDVMRGNVKGVARAPRKYRTKPEHVKQDPVYRTKRDRNNVAVRESRDKAKRAQQEKEERLAFLEHEHIKDKRYIKELEDEIGRLTQFCRCGALDNYQ